MWNMFHIYQFRCELLSSAAGWRREGHGPPRSAPCSVSSTHTPRPTCSPHRYAGHGVPVGPVLTVFACLIRCDAPARSGPIRSPAVSRTVRLARVCQSADTADTADPCHPASADSGDSGGLRNRPKGLRHGLGGGRPHLHRLPAPSVPVVHVPRSGARDVG